MATARSTRFGASAVLAAVLIAASAPAARAEDAQKRAVELYEKSAVSYREGRFQEAVDLLREAYRRRNDPVLLYNLARAYEGLGDRAHAVEAYESYLRAQPDVKDKPAIEKRITTLRAELAEREELRKQREEAVAKARDAESQPRPANVVPWVVGGVGGAVLVAGGLFGFLSVASHDSALSGSQADIDRHQSDARTFATVANIGFVAGGVLLAAGITWLLIERGRTVPARDPTGPTQ